MSTDSNKLMQQIQEQSQPEMRHLQFNIPKSSESQNQSLDQTITSAISNEIQDQNSSLGQFIRDEIIKKAALSFVQQFKAYLTNSKKTNLSKVSTQLQNIEPLFEQSQEESSDNEGIWARFGFSDYDNFSSNQSSNEDDSESQLSDDSSNKSENSLYTFQGEKSKHSQFFSQSPENRCGKLQDILLQNGEEKCKASKKEQAPPQQLKVKKLKKKLKNKENLSKKSSGPRLSSNLLAKRKKEEEEQKKQIGSKGFRKLQKMIDKLEINEKQREQKKQSQSQSQEDSESEKDQDSSEYQEESFLDMTQFQSLHLGDKQQEQNKGQEKVSKYLSLGAAKKVKIEEDEDFSKKPIYIEVQINIEGFLQRMLQKKEESLNRIQNALEAIKEIEGNEQTTHQDQ